MFSFFSPRSQAIEIGASLIEDGKIVRASLGAKTGEHAPEVQAAPDSLK